MPFRFRQGLKPRFEPFFTPAGFAIFVIAIVILIRSLLARNSYEILLSSAALIFLLILGVIGIWKMRKLKEMEPGWKTPLPMTANAAEDSLITGLDTGIPLFFRLHFFVRGRFYPAGDNNGCYVSAETSASRGGTTARLLLDFPMSGVFQGEGFCQLRDIFGFFSFVCGITQRRTVKVRNAPCFGKDYFLNAQSGAEDRRNKQSSDEERYYMREYAPGDRFRDINWKSSEKIDALITRISPDNQEKVSRIEIYFRNYGPVKRPSLQSLWMLNRAKAKLSHFLRALMEMQSSFVFSIRSAGGSWEIEDAEDLETFLDELAGLSFSPPGNEAVFYAGKGESLSKGQLYVFSTVCDVGLTGFLFACQPRPVSLFFVQPAPHQSAGTEKEMLYIRDFPAKGCVPLAHWVFSGKIKQTNSGTVKENAAGGSGAGKIENIYAETRL